MLLAESTSIRTMLFLVSDAMAIIDLSHSINLDDALLYTAHGRSSKLTAPTNLRS
jgi:hypothetical protein